MVNECYFIGQVAKDFELTTSKNGLEICKFPISIKEDIEYDGKSVSTTSFQNIICFGKVASMFASNFKKGDPIFIKGSIRYNTYKDKSYCEVNAQYIKGL